MVRSGQHRNPPLRGENPHTRWTRFYLDSWERLKPEPPLPADQTYIDTQAGELLGVRHMTRGIEDGDLIRAFNDRGFVVLAARVTERIRQRPSTHTSRARFTILSVYEESRPTGEAA